MNRIGVYGCGAVSPAGWGTSALHNALKAQTRFSAKLLERPNGSPVPVRAVPPPTIRPGFLTHSRLRRTSPISHYTVFAALEALGADAAKITQRQLRLGIIFCVTCGCVNYSRRFFEETLRDPATASPLVFPETVFNAPASHLAAFLGSAEINYTIAGDQGTYLQGLGLAAHWLEANRVDGCLVIGAEEMDWLTATAARLFEPEIEVSEGSGAIYLKRLAPGTDALAELHSVTDVFLFTKDQSKTDAARSCRDQIAVSPRDDLLCDSLTGFRRSDREEARVWTDWGKNRLSPKRVLGEGFTAASAWQCIAVVDALRNHSASSAIANVVGSNQQAIAARFVAPRP